MSYELISCPTNWFYVLQIDMMSYELILGVSPGGGLGIYTDRDQQSTF